MQQAHGLTGEVASACGHVEYSLWLEGLEGDDCCPTPPTIYAEREEMIEEVVAMGDVVEHTLHLLALFALIAVGLDSLLGVHIL